MQARDIEDFDDMLIDAELNAANDWEMDFTADLRSKYQIYGEKTFVSEKQLDQLQRISGWE